MPPDAPGTLTVAATATEIQLAWGAAAGADHYDVYRDTSAGFTPDPLTNRQTSTSALSFDDVGIDLGTRYYYVVIAVDAGGAEGPPSNEINAAVFAGIPPNLHELQVNLTQNPGDGIPLSKIAADNGDVLNPDDPIDFMSGFTDTPGFAGPFSGLALVSPEDLAAIAAQSAADPHLDYLLSFSAVDQPSYWEPYDPGQVFPDPTSWGMAVITLAWPPDTPLDEITAYGEQLWTQISGGTPAGVGPLAALMQAIADQIDGELGPLIDGLQVEPLLVPSPTPPCIDIYPDDPFLEQSAFGVESREAVFVVRARVATPDNEAGQLLLLDLLDPRGSSLLAALAADSTFAGHCDDSSIDGPSGFRTYDNAGGSGGALLGAEWRLRTVLS